MTYCLMWRCWLSAGIALREFRSGARHPDGRRLRQELTKQGVADTTLIIVSAKHGQSPIDVRDRVAISDARFRGVPGYGSHGFEICDEGLLWLDPALQKKKYANAEAYLLARASQLHNAESLDLTSPATFYEDPFENSRLPDRITVTDHGVIRTGGSPAPDGTCSERFLRVRLS